MTETIGNDFDEKQAAEAFEREIGVTGVSRSKLLVGNREFLKFEVGMNAPLYDYALLAAQKSLGSTNIYYGALGLSYTKPKNFPSSIEASALLTLLTRSTREVSQDSADYGYDVPYVPFQKREDHDLAQPASHIVRGRRGVGKSTLIRRATELLSATSSIIAVLDMQAYSTLSGEELNREVIFDVCNALAVSCEKIEAKIARPIDPSDLLKVADRVANMQLSTAAFPVNLKRALAKITGRTGANAFLFLDDFHLVDRASQPELLHILHAGLKGANGWIKVAGLTSLLNVYEPSTQQGLQVPGDAQYISLDMTLENPEAAEKHLKAILSQFLVAVGYSVSNATIPQAAFRRLAWANAGVPRDFLQMFGRALEHSRRNRRTSMTLSDVNVAIGEFGQQKMNDLQKDARNVAGSLRSFLSQLEIFCLEQNKVNAFLVRSDDSRERALVQILSDLRMVHLIHQSITPDRAGERFEAFILDYSLFTGFRRRPNVKEMVPKEPQFKASELRALPKIGVGFFQDPAPE